MRTGDETQPSWAAKRLVLAHVRLSHKRVRIRLSKTFTGQPDGIWRRRWEVEYSDYPREWYFYGYFEDVLKDVQNPHG